MLNAKKRTQVQKTQHRLTGKTFTGFTGTNKQKVYVRVGRETLVSGLVTHNN